MMHPEYQYRLGTYPLVPLGRKRRQSAKMLNIFLPNGVQWMLYSDGVPDGRHWYQENGYTVKMAHALQATALQATALQATALQATVADV